MHGELVMSGVLESTVDGIRFRKPGINASGPTAASYNSITKSREAGCGGVALKTCKPDDVPIENVAPRYWTNGKPRSDDVFGHENIELIATESVAHWTDIVKRLKDDDPDFVVIGNFMASAGDPESWQKMIAEFEAAGVDGFELNLSCPHGLPERRMGSAMGENPEIIEEVCRWCREATGLPIWAKLTPNVPAASAARAAFTGGASGVSTTNTFRCVGDLDLDDLAFAPKVSGTEKSTTGGYSGSAIAPMSRAHVYDAANVLHDEFGSHGVISGIGGITNVKTAAGIMSVGAGTFQICTGFMKLGWGIIGEINDGLQALIESRPEFNTIDDLVDCRRKSIVPFNQVLAEFLASKEGKEVAGVLRDDNWKGDGFQQQVDELTS